MPEKTTGQLIAEGRKRLGLSQEALGERLGVSRQSISKWESDAALPDIAKLVQLSRLYGVTVGALLGVEEPALPSPEGQAPENPSPETIAEEIARAWVARQPKKKRRVLPLLAGGLTAGAVLWFTLTVESRLTSLEQSYRSNQSALSQLEHTFSGLPGLVTDILEEQANLTTTHQVAFLRVDPAANAGLFRVSATPREYRPGSEALFTVTDGQQRLATAPAVWQDGVLQAEYPLAVNREFVVGGAYHNTVCIENGRVCILDADCPGQDCVKSGWQQESGRSIVCLPNRLELRLVGGSGAPEVDGVTG